MGEQRYCPICDKQMAGKRFCKNCKTFVKPLIRKNHYHINDFGCDITDSTRMQQVMQYEYTQPTTPSTQMPQQRVNNQNNRKQPNANKVVGFVLFIIFLVPFIVSLFGGLFNVYDAVNNEVTEEVVNVEDISPTEAVEDDSYDYNSKQISNEEVMKMEQVSTGVTILSGVNGEKITSNLKKYFAKQGLEIAYEDQYEYNTVYEFTDHEVYIFYQVKVIDFSDGTLLNIYYDTFSKDLIYIDLSVEDSVSITPYTKKIAKLLVPDITAEQLDDITTMSDDLSKSTYGLGCNIGDVYFHTDYSNEHKMIIFEAQ